MIPRLASLFAAVLVLVAVSGCDKKEPPSSPPPVNVQMTLFKLPRALAEETLLKQPPATDHDAVFAQLEQLVAEGRAVLVATPSLTTLAGQRAVIESILEVRYPTEFDPPQIPQSVGGETTVTTTTTTTTAEPREFGAMPTAFETRNTGVTLECEPTVIEGDLLGVNLVVGFVALQTMKEFKVFAEGARDVTLVQPYFYTRKLTTTANARSGHALFLGTIEPDSSLEKENADLTEIVFMRATILTPSQSGAK